MKFYWADKLLILGVCALLCFDAGIGLGKANLTDTQIKQISAKIQTIFINDLDLIPYVIVNLYFALLLPFIILGVYVGQQLTWIDADTFHFYMDIFATLPIILIVEYIGYFIYCIYHKHKQKKAEGKEWNWLIGYRK